MPPAGSRRCHSIHVTAPARSGTSTAAIAMPTTASKPAGPTVPSAPTSRLYSLAAEEPLHVRAQLGGRGVATRPVLVEGGGDDPVQRPAKLSSSVPGFVRRCFARAPACAPSFRTRTLGRDRVRLADRAPDPLERRVPVGIPVERERSRYGFEQHAQRVHVGSGVDVEGAHLRLLGAHVGGRAEEGPLEKRDERPHRRGRAWSPSRRRNR